MESTSLHGGTMIRVGALEGYRDLVAEMGGDPDTLLRQAGIAPDQLDYADVRIPTTSFRIALNLAATDMSQPQFSLLLSQRQSFDKFGAIGYLARHSPSLGLSIERLIRHFRTHDTGSLTSIETGEGMALWTHRLSGVADESAIQQTELAIGLACRFFRSVLGEQWSPERVLFEHVKPANLRVYDRIFRCPVEFNQAVTAIEFPAAELALPLRTSDPGLFEILQKYVDQLEVSIVEGLQSRVSAAIQANLEQGAVDLNSVAQTLGLSRHSLQSQLRTSGTTFQAVLDDVRFQQGRRLLRETRLPIGEIAALLGYAESAVFTRAFARRAGVPPRQWRAQHLN